MPDPCPGNRAYSRFLPLEIPRSFTALKSSFSLLLGQSSVYFHMGLLAARQRRSDDADSLFRKSLRMREEWYGSSHPLVAEIYDALASLSCSDAIESPDVTEAEEMFRRALHMREDLLGPSHLLVANTLFKLGQ